MITMMCSFKAARLHSHLYIYTHTCTKSFKDSCTQWWQHQGFLSTSHRNTSIDWLMAKFQHTPNLKAPNRVMGAPWTSLPASIQAALQGLWSSCRQGLMRAACRLHQPPAALQPVPAQPPPGGPPPRASGTVHIGRESTDIHGIHEQTDAMHQLCHKSWLRCVIAPCAVRE